MGEDGQSNADNRVLPGVLKPVIPKKNPDYYFDGVDRLQGALAHLSTTLPSDKNIEVVIKMDPALQKQLEEYNNQPNPAFYDLYGQAKALIAPLKPKPDISAFNFNVEFYAVNKLDTSDRKLIGKGVGKGDVISSWLGGKFEREAEDQPLIKDASDQARKLFSSGGKVGSMSTTEIRGVLEDNPEYRLTFQVQRSKTNRIMVEFLRDNSTKTGDMKPDQVERLLRH